MSTETCLLFLNRHHYQVCDVICGTVLHIVYVAFSIYTYFYVYIPGEIGRQYHHR